MTNLIFLLLSFMFNFANILDTRNSLKKEDDWSRQSNKYVASSNLLKYFTALLHEKTYLKD